MDNDTTILLSQMMKELNFTKYIELAEYFGISPASISGWIERGTTKTALKYAHKKGMDVEKLKQEMSKLKSSLQYEKNEDFNKPNEDFKKKLEKYKKLDQIGEDFQNFIAEIKKHEGDYQREFKLQCCIKIEKIKQQIITILNEYSIEYDTKKGLNDSLLDLPGRLGDGQTVNIQISENTLIDLLSKAQTND